MCLFDISQEMFQRSTGQLKCDGTRAETRFRLSAKRTRPFKSAGTSVQSTTGSRGVRISDSNAGYTMFRGSVKGTGYPLHSPVCPSLPSRASPCAITFQLESTMQAQACIICCFVHRLQFCNFLCWSPRAPPILRIDRYYFAIQNYPRLRVFNARYESMF